jgi:hypothetical protein
MMGGNIVISISIFNSRRALTGEIEIEFPDLDAVIPMKILTDRSY